MSLERLKILLAEDDDGHATLVERNLERAGVSNQVRRFTDGQQLLDYLRSERSADRECCDLLLLDIKMPRVDGVEALRQIKADPKWQSLPIIMLTTTDDPREIDRCYDLGCSVYITKPVDYSAFVEAIKRLGLFLEVVRWPRSGAEPDKH